MAKNASLYQIEVENRPGGYADVYVDDVMKKRFEGPHAIEDASKYIDELREEQKGEGQ